MARFTIMRGTPGPTGGFSFVGTYPERNEPGCDTEEEALDALAADEGDDNFQASCKRLKLGRDNYRVQRIEEEG
jgi:hypothetical protein